MFAGSAFNIPGSKGRLINRVDINFAVVINTVSNA